MLKLIGMGISDERDISLKGLDELKKCDIVFAENYTNIMKEGTIERLEEISGMKIEILEREDVEGEEKILSEAESKNVALLIPGDPLIATTHSSLLLSAKKRKIKTKVVHSSSILSAAIGESGLHAYKFGKTATLSYWTDSYKPTTPYKIIETNKSNGMHTLLLLDISTEKQPMHASHALELLRKIENELGKGIIKDDTELLVLSRVGYEDQKISFGTLSALMKKGESLGSPPFIFIIPGELHFSERDFIEMPGQK